MAKRAWIYQRDDQNPKSKKDRQHNDQMKYDKWTSYEQNEPDLTQVVHGTDTINLQSTNKTRKGTLC